MAYSADFVNQVLQIVLDGKTATDAAQAYHVNKKTVQKWCRNAGINLSSRGSHVSSVSRPCKYSSSCFDCPKPDCVNSSSNLSTINRIDYDY